MPAGPLPPHPQNIQILSFSATLGDLSGFAVNPFQTHRHKSTFQNPLRQNLLHVRALMNFLGLPENSFHSVIFFIGNCAFKTPMPPNVLNKGLQPWIKSHNSPLLDPATLQRALTCLDELQHTTNRKDADRSHMREIEARKAI